MLLLKVGQRVAPVSADVDAFFFIFISARLYFRRSGFLGDARGVPFTFFFLSKRTATARVVLADKCPIGGECARPL